MKKEKKEFSCIYGCPAKESCVRNTNAGKIESLTHEVRTTSADMSKRAMIEAGPIVTELQVAVGVANDSFPDCGLLTT